ncbi:SET domain-containing protein 5 [Elasticomyces elasticus]|uniref:SET domain-containing protein 5 n=1 Tax=Elasticomyces elasticus TaxID=574655 RepID=A0AAN7W3B5_9PEZI|nr:SET domain-containing protein 5 [Elasticomyces elasticus]
MSATPGSSLFHAASSPLHRIGLVAKQHIERGQCVLIGLPKDDQTQDTVFHAANSITLPWQGMGSLALLNHSCSPFVEVSHTEGKFYVHATRIIEEKEELTVAYVSPYQIRRERRRELGFDCNCNTCVLTEEALDASEQRRGQLVRIVTIMNGFRWRHFRQLGDDGAMMFSDDVAQSLNGDDTLGAVCDELEDFVELAAAEDICDSQLARAHEILALIYSFLSRHEPEDEQEAKLVKVTGERAVEHQNLHIISLATCLGPLHQRVKDLVESLQEDADAITKMLDLMDSMQLTDADPPRTADSEESGSASVPDGRSSTEDKAAGANDEAKEKSTEDETVLQPTTKLPESISTQPTTALPLTKPWKRLASPIHGIGLCAARDIQPSERIMSQDSIHNLGGGALDDASGLYNELLSDKDSDAAVIAMLSVTMIAPVQYAMPLSTVDEFRLAFRADGMALSEYLLKHVVKRCYFPYVQESDVYRFVRRAWQLNHSCAPNAEAAWNEPGQRLEVRTLRAIKKSEEITIPYVDIYQKTAKRWLALGFPCNCTVCLGRVSDNESFQTRITLISQSLKSIRAYRNKYTCTVSEFPNAIAQAVVTHPQTEMVMPSIVKRLGQLRVNQLGTRTSELDHAVCPPMHFCSCGVDPAALLPTDTKSSSVTHRARFLTDGESSDFDDAITCKGMENPLLSERLGLHHPRTKNGMREGMALLHADLGALTDGVRLDAEQAAQSGESDLESLESSGPGTDGGDGDDDEEVREQHVGFPVGNSVF